MEPNESTRTRIAVLGAVLLLSIGATGCTTEQDYEYRAHTDKVTLGAGDAVAANKAAQTINPWPAHAQNDNIEMDGKRAGIAIDRYQTNTSIKPKGLTADPAPSSGGGGAVKN